MHQELEGLVGDELSRPASAGAEALTRAILERHGDSVAAVLFYGSCLRRQSDEGVLDFYVLVDDYGAAYSSRWLRLANRLVPPNVFFLSLPRGPERGGDVGAGQTGLRCKYAVISRRDFEQGVSAASRLPYFWARFAQPARLLHARDDDSRRFAVRCCARSVVTLVRRLMVFLPADGDRQRFSPAALWQEAFRRTYGSELRTESDETVRAHYESEPDRYNACAGFALEVLEQEGFLDSLARRGPAFEVGLAARKRRAARIRWQLERPLGKALALVRLFKNTTTFGDWVPYILWKLERHTGKPIEVSERQRRHPFLFGWPVLARLLWQRDIF